MNSLPTFSVVVPSYNYGHFLPEAIESVLGQNRSDTQILLIDDASTDNTPELAASFGDRVQYVRNSKNMGAAGAWCVGLGLATGKYLIKLDADDKLEKGCFDAIEHAFEEDPEVGIVLSSVWVNREHKGTKEIELVTDSDRTLDADEFRRRLLRKFFFRMPGCALRKAFLNGHALPDSRLYQVHDWEYFLRVTRGRKARLLKNPGGTYRIHASSITSTAQIDNRLVNDIDWWLKIAEQPGERNLSAEELGVLRQSCAALMFIDYGSKGQTRGLSGFTRQYVKAIKIMSACSFGQMAAFHWNMFVKLMRKISG